jgi:hypothetical membrane protein
MELNASTTRIRMLAGVSLVGIACFLVTIVALHWLQPELSPLNEAMSYYVHGPHGWLLTLGLFSLGLASLTLTIALGREPPGPVGKVGRSCLAVWSVGTLLASVFAADPPGRWDEPPSMSGSIHGVAALVALAVFPVAAILLSRRRRRDIRWVRLSLLVLAFGSAAGLVAFAWSLVPVFISPGPPKLLGLTDRILIVLYSGWLGVAAVGLILRPSHRDR